LTFGPLSGRLEKEKATLPCLKNHGRYDAWNNPPKAWADRIATPITTNQGRTE
jgi:hypothetical protein